MKKLFIAVLLATTASAQAADVVYNHVPAAPVAPMAPIARVYSWEGLYIGAQGGADITSGKVTTAAGTQSGNTKIGVLGGFAGYNFAVSESIIGSVEGLFDYNFSDKVVGGKNWAGQGRARVGYAYDNALIYGLVGYGADKIDYRLNNARSTKLNGMVYGAGVDYGVTDDVFARFEYNFKDYSGDLKTGSAKTGRITSDQHVIRVGLGVKF